MNISVFSDGIVRLTQIFGKQFWVECQSLWGVYTLEYAYIPGRPPSTQETVIFLIFCCVAWLGVLGYKHTAKPYFMWLIYTLFLFTVSCLFFLFLPSFFPYTSQDFAWFYLVTQIGIFISAPLILGLSLSVFSTSLGVSLLNLIVVLFTLLYSFIFGSVRYILFLYILQKFSYILMANLFFNLGPLVDVVYISGIYTYYLSLLSKKINLQAT